MADRSFLSPPLGPPPESVLRSMPDILRNPYPSELAFFQSRPEVAGMATEDNRVALNPFSNLSPQERQAVYMNELARLLMRNGPMQPAYDLTEEQQAGLAKTEYANNPQAAKETIAARLVSGDPSAGAPTGDQLAFSRALMRLLASGWRP